MDGQSIADTASQWASDANAKLKDISERTAANAANAAETAQAMADRARAAGAEAGARLSEAAEQGGEALRDLSGRGADMARYLSETAAAHPIAAVLVTAAIGYAIGRLTLR